jgi:hypothetical protein
VGYLRLANPLQFRCWVLLHRCDVHGHLHLDGASDFYPPSKVCSWCSSRDGMRRSSRDAAIG